MKNIILALTFLSAILLFNSSCNESTLLGADLFKNELLDLTFTDSLSIGALSETNDSVIVNSGGSFINLPIGRVKDLTFGSYEARAYTELDSVSPHSFATGKIDSVVFIMGYNADGVYGDTNNVQKLSLYRLTENIKVNGGGIYSSQKFATESTPLGTTEFTPQPRTFINQGKGFTTLVDTAPQIRIKITNPSFIQQIGDTSNYASTNGSKDIFRKWLKGFEIRSEKETSCMLNMDFGSSASNITGLYIYSKKDTTKSVSFFKSVSSANIKYSYFKNDYKNAPIEPFLNNQKLSDSLLFLQGMSGTNIKLEIPYIKNLGKIVINKAELELTIKQDGVQSDLFPGVNQILVRTAAQDVISDVIDGDATSRAAKFPTSGGFISVKTEGGEKVSKYVFNISSHLQRILEGKEGNQIYLMPFFKQENTSRVVLYGLNKQSKYRAKINLTYTKIP
jgi:Domain of unknown function (DUF4270)